MIKGILIVGLGSIGKRYLRLAREFLPEAEIAVLRHKVDLIIPKGANYIFSNMPEFFEPIQSKSKRTIACPMHELWMDIGRSDDLQKANVISE